MELTDDQQLSIYRFFIWKYTGLSSASDDTLKIIMGLVGEAFDSKERVGGADVAIEDTVGALVIDRIRRSGGSVASIAEQALRADETIRILNYTLLKLEDRERMAAILKKQVKSVTKALGLIERGLAQARTDQLVHRQAGDVCKLLTDLVVAYPIDKMELLSESRSYIRPSEDDIGICHRVRANSEQGQKNIDQKPRKLSPQGERKLLLQEALENLWWGWFHELPPQYDSHPFWELAEMVGISTQEGARRKAARDNDTEVIS